MKSYKNRGYTIEKSGVRLSNQPVKWCLDFWTLILWSAILFVFQADAQSLLKGVKKVNADSGWARNSVNAVVFRKNSLTSIGKQQYIAFYDKNGQVVLGKRKLKSTQWQLKKTGLKGNAKDAHNSISIMADGEGFLHMAWDHHGNRLHYTRSKTPGSLDLEPEMPMTGQLEEKVTYPEFYRLPGGDLIFIYRDGQSGRGNLVMNRYDIKTKRWQTVHTNLVDGEGKRNAYWQASVDKMGTIHLSWVWRESADVASNHDLCYAQSKDAGKTWQKTNGSTYQIPINAATAEYAVRIPEKSELINQTSMATDDAGHPWIASYWRAAGDSVPQYHLVYFDGQQWNSLNTGFRHTPFSLSGVGSKRIPISRPQILTWPQKGQTNLMMIFRDDERQQRVSVAICADISKPVWQLADLSDTVVGAWEPSFDTNLWLHRHELHLFVQAVEQVDGEGLASAAPAMVQVWQWKPGRQAFQIVQQFKTTE